MGKKKHKKKIKIKRLKKIKYILLKNLKMKQKKIKII